MIKLQCQCGKLLSLPDKLAGKKLKCKDCGKVMTVPEKRDGDSDSSVDRRSIFYIEGLRKCPGCDKGYPEKVLICTTCGINLETGAQLYASVESSGGHMPMPTDDDDEMDDDESPSFADRILSLLGLKKR